MNSLNKGSSFTAFFLLALGLQLTLFSANAAAQTEIETIKVDMAGCVDYDHERSRGEKAGYVFEDQDALEEAFDRPDEYNKLCRKAADSIDFTRYTLLGIDIRNAECHNFPLEYKVVKDDAALLYRLQILHPHLTSPCAGIYTYGVWVLVPKLHAGYRAAFEVSEKLTLEEKQYGREVRFFHVGGMASFPNTCLQVNTRVYNEESLKKLFAFDQCKKMFDGDKVDLKEETLIGWHVGGDCHMSVETRLYRDDQKKLFTVLIKNRWGGCRAGGWRQGMFTIPKIPDDYQVKFVQYLMDDLHSDNFREDFDRHRMWSAGGEDLAPRPNISPAPTEEPAASPELPAPAGSPKGADAMVTVLPADETEVPVLRKTGSRYHSCRGDIGGIYTEADYQALLANKECTVPQELKVDLKKESLIGFHASGDCHVSARARVSRNDKTKTYTIAVNKLYGGCRAYGQYRGWIVIEKMRPDYQVKWRHTTTDESGVTEMENPASYLHPQTLETREVDIKGCIWLYGSIRGQTVIKDNETFQAAIRKDGQVDFCRKNLEKIDFSQNTLLGIDLNTGYCRTPIGLESQAVRDDAKKQVTLHVSYLKPDGVCRALSSYDLWVLVPKIPEGYEVKYEVKTVDR